VGAGWERKTRISTRRWGHHVLVRRVLALPRSVGVRMGVVALLLGLAAGILSVPEPVAAAPLAITDVRIIDGNGGRPVEHGAIVADGKRIVAVGPATTVTIPAGSMRIDGKGMSVLPGLADMHVHLLGGTNGIGLDLLGYQKYLNALLYAGVTTVLDTGNVEPFVLQLRAEVAAGRIVGPRIYCVGPILDGADPVWPALSVAISSKDQVSRIVASLAEDKVDFIKLYVGLSDPLVRVISAEAHQRGLRTIIDQWRRNGSADLAGTGIAGFAHFPSHRISDETIDNLRKSGVFFISTLAVQESATGRRWADLSFLDHPLIADTLPRAVLDQLRREYGGHATQTPEDRSTYTMKVDLAGAESNVPRIRDAGILFATGTDAVYPGDFQGEGLHRELELLVESGLTPLEAITAATRSAAAIVGASSEWGTLEAGKLANILMVSGRPDQHIGDTRNIVLLVKDGKVVDRPALTLARSHVPDYGEVGPAMAPVW
jgi:imidazolonepropionase-like amidohydrolase